MPLLARLLSSVTGHSRPLTGPFTLGKYGLPLNFLGLSFLIFTSITFNFPTLSPVDKDNMNYTSAAIGVIGLISVVTWISTGRKYFTGPQVGAARANITHGVALKEDEGSGNGSEEAIEEQEKADLGT